MLSVFSQDSIQDLIRKSRQNTTNFSSFLNKATNDITNELGSKDKDVKLKALVKLLFLYLNYNDIQWASFNSIEVMSTGGAEGKRYSYLITQLQFKNNKDFIQLIPNQIRSDIKKHNLNYINSALNFLNAAMNYQIAVELLKDIESLLNINNSLIRKKVIVTLTLACEQFAKVSSFAYWDDYLIKLITLLTSQGVQSSGVAICIISSIQRMCRVAPKQCMTVFVELMTYFTKCEVNWNLIKVIDIFGMLFKAEPKFTRKKEFIKILAEQMVKTKSKSVEAQLVKLVLTHFDQKMNPNASELIQSSEERLKQLIFSQDNNLLVLSLRILKGIFEKGKLSESSHSYVNDIFALLNNNNKPKGNVQIVRECIDLLLLMASKENFVRICEDVRKVIPFVGKYAIDAVIDLCSRDSYSLIVESGDLKWFIGMMFDIAKEQCGKEAEERVAFVLRDLSQRIDAMRDVIVHRSVELVESLVQQNKDEASQRKGNTGRVDHAPIGFNMKDNKEELDHNGGSGDRGHSNSLMNALLFIMGEYSEEKEIIKTTESVYNALTVNSEVKLKHYAALLLCLMKLLIKHSADKKISKEDYEKYSLIKYEGNNIESIELSDYFLTTLTNLHSNEIKADQLKSILLSNPLKPLAANAHLLIKPPESFDLALCLPINDCEIQMTKKPSSIKEDNKVSIDKTLYTPPAQS